MPLRYVGSLWNTLHSIQIDADAIAFSQHGVLAIAI
jgi:hypothetical protein